MIQTTQLALASLLDRVFGLDDSMSLGNDNTALGWEYPLPAWGWVMVILAAGIIALMSYTRLEGARWMRVLLASLRALTLLVIAVLLVGPMIVRTDVTEEPDWLLVMVDRSASMNFEDVEVGIDGLQTPQVISREASLRAALAEQMAVFGESGLGKGRRVLWFGYDREAYPIDAPTVGDGVDGEPSPRINNLAEPEVQATNLRSALDQALQAAAGRAVSGIVLFGDGQSPQPTDEDFAQQLMVNGLQVPVFSVQLGSAAQRLDLAIERVDLPASAFAGDLVPVAVTVRRQDIPPGVVDGLAIDPADVVIRLVHPETGEVFDTQTLEQDGFGSPVRLQVRSDEAGDLDLSVEVAYEPGEGGASTVGSDALGEGYTELAVSNNRRQASVELISRPMRVLYVDGAPRWQYRYLVSMLLREQSIDSSMLLVEASPDFVQEGNTRITRFPQTAEEIRQYDVIIIGDVHPRFFSDRQFTLIRDHISSRGAGLLWIGGPRYTPSFYTDTDLALLLPMTSPGSVGRLVPSQGRTFDVEPTDAATLLNLMQLSLNRGDVENPDEPDWPEDLPPLYWAQDLGPLQPGAKTLAVAPGMVDRETGLAAPLVALYRYGAGEVIYVGTDETWRWRKAGGEVYFEQFWIQLIRKLGRQRIQSADDRATFTLSPPVVDLGATQLAELVIDDPALVGTAPPKVRVAVYRQGEEDTGEPVGELELRPTGSSGEAGTAPRATYSTTWRSDRPGLYTLKVSEPLLEFLDLSAPAEIRDPAQELARAATDHTRLQLLATSSGGEVIPLDNLALLNGKIEDLSREISTETRKPLTNTLIALVIILLLLTTEWILRRLIKLI
ncbi:MAG: hypothetical protein AAGC44_05530 [Planctomycetota bacterium]